MCVGILPVAEAGLLQRKAATTYFLSRNHDHAERLRVLGCTLTQGPIEVCDRIISCSGPAQSVDVALLLLESLIGPEAGREVRRFMAGMEWRPSSTLSGMGTRWWGQRRLDHPARQDHPHCLRFFK